MRQKFQQIAIIAFWIALWQLVSMVLGQEMLLVSPVSACQALFTLVQTPDFWLSVFNSLVHILSGFLSALFAGCILGVVAGQFRVIEVFLAPCIQTVKSIPVASFVILALVWVRPQELSVFVSFCMVFPLVYSNMLEGMKSLDCQLLEFAQVFRLNTRAKWRGIYFPQLLSYLRAASSLGLGLCWKAGVAAEVIGLPAHSIGEHLFESKVYLDTPNLFAWTFVIIVISLCFEKLFSVVLRCLVDKGMRGL